MAKYPMGFWNYTQSGQLGPKDVEDWKDCGMNLVLSPEYDSRVHHKEDMLALLDACEERGIQMILCDPPHSMEGGFHRRGGLSGALCGGAGGLWKPSGGIWVSYRGRAESGGRGGLRRGLPDPAGDGAKSGSVFESFSLARQHQYPDEDH